MPSHSNRPDRIVVLTHEFYPDRGGIATYVQGVARAATLNGISIEVWAPKRSKEKGLQFRNPQLHGVLHH